MANRISGFSSFRELDVRACMRADVAASVRRTFSLRVFACFIFSYLTAKMLSSQSNSTERQKHDEPKMKLCDANAIVICKFCRTSNKKSPTKMPF